MDLAFFMKFNFSFIKSTFPGNLKITSGFFIIEWNFICSQMFHITVDFDYLDFLLTCMEKISVISIAELPYEAHEYKFSKEVVQHYNLLALRQNDIYWWRQTWRVVRFGIICTI